MKFLNKKITAMALVAVMTMSLSTVAFAEEIAASTSEVANNAATEGSIPATPLTTATTSSSAISIQLNGDMIDFTDAAPVSKDGRTFVPGRMILESLGAAVSFDEATNTITAKKDTTVISVRVGNPDIMVTEGETTKTVKTDAAPFVEKDRLYVPARFAAEVLGCSVGWDDAAKTVIIVDTDKLLKSLEGKYTMMDKYLAYSKELSEKSLAVKGDFTLNYKIKDGDKTLPITGSGTIDGITDAEKAEMAIALKLNIDELTKLMDDATKADPVTKEMLALLGDIKMNLILDMTTGKYYMQSPLLEIAFGTAKDAWVMLDFNEIFASANLGVTFSDIVGMPKTDNFASFIGSMVKTMPLTDVNSYGVMKESITLFDKMFSDTSLVKSGDNYTSDFTTTQDGVAVTLKTTFMTSGDKVVGYSMDTKASMSGLAEMTILASTDADNKTVVKMSMTMQDMTEMVMEMNMQSTATDKKPAGAPAKGSEIISIMDMLK